MRSSPIARLMIVAVLAILASAAPSFALNHEYAEDFTSRLYCDTSTTTAHWDTVAGEISLQPFALSIVGNYDTSRHAIYMDICGDLLYLTDQGGGSGELLILDISDPASPTLIGNLVMPSEARFVDVDGNYAYVTCDNGQFCVVDVSNPAAPTLVATRTLGDIAQCVAVTGDFAYVAARTYGLAVFDISDPEDPLEIGRYDSPGYPDVVVVAGDFAYIGDGPLGFKVIDISDPTTPTLVGGVDTPGYVRGIALSGDLAFIADLDSGVLVYDVQDPTSPFPIGGYDTPHSATHLSVSGDRLYVTDGSGGDLLVLDISDPANPTLQTSLTTPGDPFAVNIEGRLAYVGDYSAGLQVIEIGEAVVPPLPTGSFGTLDFTEDVAIAGNRAFVTDREAGLRVLDISDPANPVLTGSCDTPGLALGITIGGNSAYLADYGHGLQVIDISDPSNPVIAGNYDTPGTSYSVSIAGDNAFVADGLNGFLVVDITDPSHPAPVGSYSTGNDARNIALAGDVAYVANHSSGLLVLDIRDPTNPVFLSSRGTPNAALDVVVAGDRVFVADRETGLLVFDVSVPSNPNLIGSVGLPDNAIGVAVAGNLAYVAARYSGLQVVDISNPGTPVLLGGLDTPDYAYRVTLAGDYAYVADHLGGLQIAAIMQRQVQTDADLVQSLDIDQSSDSIIRARLTTDQTDTIAWQLSADGGTAWDPILPGSGWHAFSSPGPDLLWRSTHTYSIPTVNPTCTQLDIHWLYEFPAIDSVADVPNDNGGQVLLNWVPSAYDIHDLQTITHYSVWRAIPSGTPGKSDIPLVQPADIGINFQGPGFRSDHTPRVDLYWEWLCNMNAYYLEGYAYAAPTLYDAIGTDPALHYFQVIGHTADQWVFWISPPDSGSSVDNLPPGVPEGLSVAYGLRNVLSWELCEDADFQHFRIYRGDNPNFTPSPANLVHSTITTEWVDPTEPGWGYHYKITALDHSSNESEPASPDLVTALDDTVVPVRFALHGNVPNPFNPLTTIRFDLPRAAEVTLRIFDLSGRLVDTLQDGEHVPAGRHEIAWNGRDTGGRPAAAGVYFYRLEAGAFADTKRMTLVK